LAGESRFFNLSMAGKKGCEKSLCLYVEAVFFSRRKDC
jgi:hypothetical protein